MLHMKSHLKESSTKESANDEIAKLERCIFVELYFELFVADFDGIQF